MIAARAAFRVFSVTSVVWCCAWAAAQEEPVIERPPVEAPGATTLQIKPDLKYSACEVLADRLERFYASRRDERGLSYAWWSVEALPGARDCAGATVHARVLPVDLPALRQSLTGADFLRVSPESIPDSQYVPLLTKAILDRRLAAFGEHGGMHVVAPADFDLASVRGRTWSCRQPTSSSDMDGAHDYTRTFAFRLEPDGGWSDDQLDRPSNRRYYLLSGPSVYLLTIAPRTEDYADIFWGSIDVSSVSGGSLRGPFGLECSAR